MLLDEMEFKEGVLKACANEGKDCGACVAMLAWLMDITSRARTLETKAKRKSRLAVGGRRMDGVVDGGEPRLPNDEYAAVVGEERGLSVDGQS